MDITSQNVIKGKFSGNDHGHNVMKQPIRHAEICG